jgi:F-type H+-transporting ATPase subunit b
VEFILTQFASSASGEEKTDILTGLGIDWTLMALQLVAFLILVWILGKFVYPVFLRIIDERQAKIDESVKAAADAVVQAEKAETAVEDALKQARKEAADIVATAKSEAVAMVEKAESSAKTKAERIVTEAQESIQKEVLAAKKSLEKDTLDLVKRAASIATAGVADAKFDAALIKKSVEGAKK